MARVMRMRGVLVGFGAILIAVTSVAQAAPAVKSVSKPIAVVKLPPAPDETPLWLGKRYADIRTATPGVAWTMTPVERYAGRGFVRVLSARHAAGIDGIPLDVIIARGPRATIEAQHFISDPMIMSQGDCVAKIGRMAELVAQRAGLPPKQESWAGEALPTQFGEPWPHNIADRLTRGEALTDEVFSRRPSLDSSFVRQFSNDSGKEVAIESTGLLSSVHYPRDRPALTWWGFLKSGSLRWTFLSTFTRSYPAGGGASASFENPPETDGVCRISFSVQSGALGQPGEFPFRDTQSLVVPRYDFFTRDQLSAGGSLADRYYALLFRKANGLKGDEADTYLCDVAIGDNRLVGCSHETPAPPQPKGQPTVYTPRTAAQFLSGYAIPGPLPSEDDFSQRHARVQFAFRPDDTVPDFDWGKVGAYTPPGILTNRQLNINSDDYPPIAFRNELQADVAVDCLVLPDYSVFCGRVTATIISGKLPDGSTQKADEVFANAVSSVIARRMRGVRAEPKKLDGSDSRGSYFRTIIKFRLPK